SFVVPIAWIAVAIAMGWELDEGGPYVWRLAPLPLSLVGVARVTRREPHARADADHRAQRALIAVFALVAQVHLIVVRGVAGPYSWMFLIAFVAVVGARCWARCCCSSTS